jgi:hypothetical protein
MENFKLEFSDNLIDYKEYNISEASRWAINIDYYNDLLKKCNVGMYLTYNPINYNKKQIASLIIGYYKDDILYIELICSKRFFLIDNIKSSFGEYMIYKLYEHLKPKEIIINNVSNDMLSYYIYLGYKVRDKDKVLKSNIMIPNLKDNEDLNTFFEKSNRYLSIKLRNFHYYLLSDPLVLEEALSCC